MLGEFGTTNNMDYFSGKNYHKSAPGGYVREEQEAEIDNGDGGGEKELVNSKDPHYPFIYLLGEGTWAEM
jgi:hypothetical protein